MKIRIILAALLLMVFPARTEPEGGVVLTLATGTAQRLVVNRTMASSMIIQAQHGGSHLIYILNANPANTCVLNGAGTTLVAELSPATSAAPGGAFTFPSNGTSIESTSGFDLSYWCVQGTTSDTVIASWDIRN